MGVFNLYLYIYIPTVGIDQPFQASKYMLVSLIVHFNLSVMSGFNTNCSILLL